MITLEEAHAALRAADRHLAATCHELQALRLEVAPCPLRLALAEARVSAAATLADIARQAAREVEDDAMYRDGWAHPLALQERTEAA